MVRKKVSTWLIGAAMSFATPGGDVRTETVASPEEMVSTSEMYEPRTSLVGSGNQNIWRYGEPMISDLLTDPITRLLMKRDGVSWASLVVLIASVREKLLTSATGEDETSV